MDSVYRQVPISRSTRRFRKQQQPCGLSQYKGSCKFPQSLNFPHKVDSGCYTNMLSHQCQDSTCHMSGEDVMSPVNVLNSLPQKPWFTVLSLGQMIAAEQVKVQLNPLSRILLIKAYPRTFSKQQHQQQKVQHLLTLPKNIRMDKLQVRLTTRGELVVIAPFKFTQQGESGNKWFGLGEEDSLSNVMNTLYQQQGNNPLMQWIPIPIHTTRSITRNASSRSFYGPYQSGTETESTSSSSSDTSSEEDTTSCSSTSTSESESEWESIFPMSSTTNPMFKKISNKRSTCGSGKSHSYSPMPLNNIYITKSALSQQCGKKQQQKQLSQRTSRCQYSS